MSGDIISLNVGGTIYTTSRSTLTRYPDSRLAALFANPSSEFCPLDAQGNFFVDRDGQSFRYVLNFLRTQQIILPTDSGELQTLAAEGSYYKIDSLINAISQKPSYAHLASQRVFVVNK